MPYERTGPGTALDGKARFDLDQFNQAYFDRLRERVVAANERGIYVAIVLFNGWSVADNKGGFGDNNPWRGHPFNESNNINGIDGDTNNDNSGEEVHELGNTAVTAIQEAYVRKVIDTVNDLDNVLFEISNESHGDSEDWQYHMINFIKDYEATLPQQHPVGMTVEYPNGSNSELFNSPADWISPKGSVSNPDRRWQQGCFSRYRSPVRHLWRPPVGLEELYSRRKPHLYGWVRWCRVWCRRCWLRL